MIHKIQRNEYSKRYDNMEVAERQEYANRVGRWLSNGGRLLAARTENDTARIQNVIQLSIGWNDAECQAFEEGARLLSALAGSGGTWLPDLLYEKAARRVVRHLTGLLSGIKTDEVVPTIRTEGSRKEEAKPVKSTAEAKTREHISHPMAQAVPVRPKHIDGYVHLLPINTQKRAAKVKELLMEMDSAREAERLLMGSPQASDSERAALAARITSLDRELGSIYRELDTEWDKLAKSGRVTVDDLGNAHVAPSSNDGESGESPEPAELTAEQKHRRRELRKFLVDTRRGNGKTRQEHLAKWDAAWTEYLSLESRENAMADDRIMAAARHYGIEIS